MAEAPAGAARPGRKPGKLEGIEAARGVAAFLVVLPHVTTILAVPAGYGTMAFGGLFIFGRAGVDFFFVLSGFIIAYVHSGDIGRPAAFSGFWRKRLLRIFPPYWVATAILGALLFLSPSRDLSERDPVHVVLSLLLLPEAQLPLLGVGWSLRHEMLFYLLFSIAVFHRRIGVVLLGCWAVAIAVAALHSGWTGERVPGGAIGQLVFRLFNLQFFFGMGVAWLVLNRRAWRPGLLLAAGVVLFLGNGMVESFVPGMWPEQPGLTMVYATASALMVYGLAELDRHGTATVPRFLVMLGGASYSIYLTHVITILIVGFALRPLRPVLPLDAAFVVCAAAAVVGGIAFNRLIERPLLRWGRGAAALRVEEPRPARSANP